MECRRAAWIEYPQEVEAAVAGQVEAGLVGPLDEPDGELGPQGHDRAAPSLPGRGITEAVRLKVISGIDEETLRSLIINI